MVFLSFKCYLEEKFSVNSWKYFLSWELWGPPHMCSHSSLQTKNNFSWMFYTHTRWAESRKVKSPRNYCLPVSKAIWLINISASLPINWGNPEDFSLCFTQSTAGLCSWAYGGFWLDYGFIALIVPHFSLPNSSHGLCLNYLPNKFETLIQNLSLQFCSVVK